MSTAKGALHADMIRVRRSKIHGSGVFALRTIRKGTRIIEYVGERISHEEADRRYEDKPVGDAHTFLFTVDDKVVVDAGVGGSDARYINHSCDPNCETEIVGRRIFVSALRTIPAGEELHYDYMIARDADDAPNIDRIFACHCNTPQCRGTMLVGKPPVRRRKK